MILPGRAAHYQAQNTVSGANLLFSRRLQGWERHDSATLPPVFLDCYLTDSGGYDSLARLPCGKIARGEQHGSLQVKSWIRCC